jgi:PKD repeat protein
MNIRELFRYKLENSEQIPGESVRTDLMRKLARREFIRFNPSRFNIYYMGSIAAAGIVAALLLTTNPGAGRKPGDIAPSNSRHLTDTPSEGLQNQQQTERQPVVNKADKNLNVRSISVPDSSLVSERKTILIKPERKTGKTVTEERSDSLPKKSLIKNNIPERNNIFILQKKTEAAFEVSSRSGCAPLKVKFLNKSAAYDSCQWMFGDGGSSLEKNPEWIFDVEGEYKVLLKAFSSNGTEAVASSVIMVHPKPVARFEIYPQKPIIPDDDIRFINYSMDAVKFKWEFGDGTVSEAFEPDHKYDKYKSYNVQLIVWSEYGCADSLMVLNAFSGSGCYIDFPNAFIPNPDGPAGGYYSIKSDEAAQIFHPVTSGVSDYQLRIFSKMGILIFESNDINFGWDGYMKGQLCEPGVYIWKVRGTFKNGEPFVKMGDVTLLKK